MTPVESLRKYLIDKFVTDFKVSFPNTDIRFENIRMANLKNAQKPLVYIVDEPVAKQRISIGSKQERQHGTLHLFALAPEDSGSRVIREYVDKTAAIFDWLDVFVPNVGYLRTKSITYDTINLHDATYTIKIAIDYQCDLCY